MCVSVRFFAHVCMRDASVCEGQGGGPSLQTSDV